MYALSRVFRALSRTSQVNNRGESDQSDAFVTLVGGREGGSNLLLGQ